MKGTTKKFKARYDVERLSSDMARKGWIATDLARAADVSDMTVSRFLAGDTQTPRVADKLAKALGFSARRYFLGVAA